MCKIEPVGHVMITGSLAGFGVWEGTGTRGREICHTTRYDTDSSESDSWGCFWEGVYDVVLGVCSGLYVVILCVVEEIVVKIAGDREEQIILYFCFSDKPNETLLYSYIVYYTISPPYKLLRATTYVSTYVIILVPSSPIPDCSTVLV